MSRILITTFGSYGDLYPYLAIGSELAGRGHQVTIATSAAYREKAEAHGLRFAPVRPDVDLGDREFLEYVFDARHGSQRIIRAMSELVRDSYEDTLPAAEDAEVIVTHPLTFGATLIAKKRGVPWISTALAPVSFLSACDPPVPAPAPWLRNLRFLGPGPFRLLWSIGKRQALDWTRPVIHFAEKELGLTAEQVGNPLFEGAMSPQLTLALFSPLFASPQPDWPASAVITGFPFSTTVENAPELPTELGHFLRNGPPPVVFTLGSSAVGAAGDFYRDSFRAVEALGVRTLFLTGSHAQGLPARLPEYMLEWPYASHAAVFPRAALIVHQGGIGTTAEALRSGRPALVVPFAHDQFDNAERVRRLGSGRWVGRASWTAVRARRELENLLGDSKVEQRCSEVASQIRAEEGTRNAATAIERITNC